MDRVNLPQRELQKLFLHIWGLTINKKGSALLLALVLSMAVLPAAGVLTYIARSDLASALDDYHYVRISYSSRTVLSLVTGSLLYGGDGLVICPDSDIVLSVDITEISVGWHVTVKADDERATTQVDIELTKPNMEE